MMIEEMVIGRDIKMPKGIDLSCPMEPIKYIVCCELMYSVPI